jgi:hypothetical protein
MWRGFFWNPPDIAISSSKQMHYNLVMQKNFLIKLWISRLFIAVVTFWNIQAAFVFILHPEGYAGGFELSGAPGAAMVQGMGLLFLMWNVPYVFALVHPVKRFVSLVEAVLMQAIGAIGESILLVALQGEHPQLHVSVQRFILFDGAGLVILLIALGLVVSTRRKSISETRP